jgi:hypothetical protein
MTIPAVFRRRPQQTARQQKAAEVIATTPSISPLNIWMQLIGVFRSLPAPKLDQLCGQHLIILFFKVVHTIFIVC